MTYALRLSDSELARYRMMAQRARRREADLWALAGLVPGAQVADVGCGPGAILMAVAEAIGPDGQVIGVDADAHALQAAKALITSAALTNAAVHTGRAEDTGLPETGFDVVLLRHVLAHNGKAEQPIVDHVARLLRPGGNLYLLDGDWTASSMSGVSDDLAELEQRYVQWHAARGNDLRVGRRLAALGRAAGLEIEEFRGWFEITDVPPGIHGPAWAARDALVADGLADAADLARWQRALDVVDARVERPQMMMAVFAAVCRRRSTG
jgi:SAM-dependent methyltransferase